jgi:hypothetical protein
LVTNEENEVLGVQTKGNEEEDKPSLVFGDESNTSGLKESYKRPKVDYRDYDHDLRISKFLACNSIGSDEETRVLSILNSNNDGNLELTTINENEEDCTSDWDVETCILDMSDPCNFSNDENDKNLETSETQSLYLTLKKNSEIERNDVI